jgi:hypothetical protein
LWVSGDSRQLFLKLGLPLNFGARHLKTGIRRIVLSR